MENTRGAGNLLAMLVHEEIVALAPDDLLTQVALTEHRGRR